MDCYFTAQADKEYQEWCKTDKKIFKKINDLIEDIVDKGFLNGIGKPEQLKYYKDPVRYSRRITKNDRLVYSKYKEDDLIIISSKGHYED